MRWALCIGLVAGCYAPQPPQGAPCGSGDECPSGQMCFDGFCAITAPDRDAAPDTSVDPGDAPVDTRPPVPPTLRFGERPDAIGETWVDTFLNDAMGEAANNFGNHPDLHLTAAEIAPVLIHVDVTEVPAHAIVTSAKLHFVVTAETIPVDTTIEVFAMNESWTEGTGDHSAGIANMTLRTPNLAWSVSGARPPSRTIDAIASVTASATLEFGDELVIALPSELVAGWVADASTNHGIAVIVNGGPFYCELASSEAGSLERRPFLDLDLE